MPAVLLPSPWTRGNPEGAAVRVRFPTAIIWSIVLVAGLQGCVRGEGPSSPTVLEQTPGTPPGGGASCVFAIGLTSLTLGADGDTATVSIDAGPTCSWAITASESWVSIQPASGQGPSSVQLSAAPNPAPTPRSVTLQLAEHRATVTQLAANCGFDVSPSGESFSPVAAGGGQFQLPIDTGRATCEWTAASDVPWLTLTPSRGTGGATATLVVAPNDSSQRAGTLAVAGRAIRVVQAPGECAYAVTGTSQTVSNTGGTVTIRVDAQPGCRWEVEGRADWFALSPTSGSGSTDIRGTAAANLNEAPRTATFRIASQTVRIVQSGCSLTVSPTSIPLPYADVIPVPDDDDLLLEPTFDIDVTTTCAWTVSGAPSWLTFVPASGTGATRISGRATVNTAGERVATIQIGSRQVRITQAEAPVVELTGVGTTGTSDGVGPTAPSAPTNVVVTP